jgi:hypothetical protein
MYVCMYGCTDVYMYVGCMDVWMYGCYERGDVDDGRMYVWTYVCVDVLASRASRASRAAPSRSPSSS